MFLSLMIFLFAAYLCIAFIHFNMCFCINNKSSSTLSFFLFLILSCILSMFSCKCSSILPKQTRLLSIMPMCSLILLSTFTFSTILSFFTFLLQINKHMPSSNKFNLSLTFFNSFNLTLLSGYFLFDQVKMCLLCSLSACSIFLI